MRDVVARAAPQAPARNNRHSTRHSTASLDTFNSHRKLSLPNKRVYRPVRRRTLSRIDETSSFNYKSSLKSLQQSTDFSSTRPAQRSRSNMSADTSRSVPVCNQSHELGNQLESPQYMEPGYESSDSYHQASMTDLPVTIPADPATGAYIPYPEYSYYHDERCGFKWKLKPRKQTRTNNLFLAFMY